MDGPQFPYEWNPPAAGGGRVEVHDETLRDGLQSPSIVDPSIEDKIEFIHRLAELGVESVNLGLPGAGPRAFADVVRLAEEIRDAKLPLRATCAGRTLACDIEPIARASQRVGIPITAMTFIGSSPIRRYVEGWPVALIRQRSVDAISFAASEGLPITYVTEDTTRSHPEVLRELFTAAIEHGANALCLCDTVGHATPDGTRNLVRFAEGVVAESGAPVLLEWHGHNDRGFALVNALAAAEAGVQRIHGCVLGIGERVGNTPLELLVDHLVAMRLSPPRDLSGLSALCEHIARATARAASAPTLERAEAIR